MPDPARSSAHLQTSDRARSLRSSRAPSSRLHDDDDDYAASRSTRRRDAATWNASVAALLSSSSNAQQPKSPASQPASPSPSLDTASPAAPALAPSPDTAASPDAASHGAVSPATADLDTAPDHNPQADDPPPLDYQPIDSSIASRFHQCTGENVSDVLIAENPDLLQQGKRGVAIEGRCIEVIPGSLHDLQLCAHELTHIVQQRGPSTTAPHSSLVSEPEIEAIEASNAIISQKKYKIKLNSNSRHLFQECDVYPCDANEKDVSNDIYSDNSTGDVGKEPEIKDNEYHYNGIVGDTDPSTKNESEYNGSLDGSFYGEIYRDFVHTWEDLGGKLEFAAEMGLVAVAHGPEIAFLGLEIGTIATYITVCSHPAMEIVCDSLDSITSSVRGDRLGAYTSAAGMFIPGVSRAIAKASSQLTSRVLRLTSIIEEISSGPGVGSSRHVHLSGGQKSQVSTSSSTSNKAPENVNPDISPNSTPSSSTSSSPLQSTNPTSPSPSTTVQHSQPANVNLPKGLSPEEVTIALSHEQTFKSLGSFSGKSLEEVQRILTTNGFKYAGKTAGGYYKFYQEGLARTRAEIQIRPNGQVVRTAKYGNKDRSLRYGENGDIRPLDEPHAQIGEFLGGFN